VLALTEILHLGGRFVVGGRVTPEGEFVTLEVRVCLCVRQRSDRGKGTALFFPPSTGHQRHRPAFFPLPALIDLTTHTKPTNHTQSVLAQAVPIPPAIRAMFHGLSEAEFRVDLSSTQIRARLAAKGEKG
jgi:hypothetical protein